MTNEEEENRKEQLDTVDADQEDEFFAVEQSPVYGAMKFGILTILLGFISLGCLLPLLLDQENFNNLRRPLVEAGSEYSLQLTLPFVFIACVFLYFASGVLSLLAYFKSKMRSQVFLAMLISLLASAIALWITVSLRITLGSLLLALQGNPIVSDFTQGDISVMDFTGAVFNECCMSTYDSLNYHFKELQNEPVVDSNGIVDLNQRLVPKCNIDLNTTCPTATNDPNRMFPELVSTVLDGLGFEEANEFLCHCITNEVMYDEFLAIIRRDNLCEKYRKIIIKDVDSIEVPLIGQSFSQLVNLIAFVRPEFVEQLPMKEFAIVGKMLPPAQLYNEPAEEVGWSCGLGYAKSLSFYMFVYVDTKTKFLVIGGYTVVGVGFASCMTLLFMWTCSSSSQTRWKDESFEYGYNKQDQKDEVLEKTYNGKKEQGEEAKNDINGYLKDEISDI